MKKVLLIIPDCNKGKFISNGFSSSFHKLDYFVSEMKIYDLNKEAVNKFNPDIIFIDWSDIRNKNKIETFTDEIECKSDFIHYSEFQDDIPEKYKNIKSHYIFYQDLNKYLSVNPKDYKSSFSEYKYNITFVGNPSYKNREYILVQLIKNFGKINIFCRSYDFYKSVDDIVDEKLLSDYEIDLYRKSYQGYLNSTKELSDVYISSKINIDIENLKSKKINYRLLEITSSGGFVIAPYNEFLIKQFDEGKDIETYKDIYELVDKINFYLKNQGIAEIIAINGKKNTISNFSNYDILKKMLKEIYGENISGRR